MMKSLFFFLILPYFLAVPSCGISTDSKSTPIVESPKYNVWRDYINFDTLSVRGYVELLKLKEIRPNSINVLTTGHKAKIGWIKEKDVEYLIQLVKSKDPAYCVMQFISSQAPTPFSTQSTIGGQVMNMIDAYRFAEEYPSFLMSCAENDQERAKVILNWWNTYKKKTGAND